MFCTLGWMSRKKRRKIPPGTPCVYCGGLAEDWDHVPPQCLFAKKNRRNLIEVPSCKQCNNSRSDDDTYLLQMLTMREDTASFPDAKEGRARLLRGMQDPSRRKFLQATVANFEIRERWAGDVYLGPQPAFQIDWPRINRVIARIVRGLFFHETGKVLPSQYVAVSFHFEGFDRYDIHMMSTLKRIHDNALAGGVRTVGGGVFEYGHRATEGDPSATVWALRFYEAPSFVAFTAPSDWPRQGDDNVAFYGSVEQAVG